MADAKSGSGQYKKLPPGWDCKYDKATGNCYYINYFTKAMQLEDPRMCYRALHDEKCSNESIALAPLHGSPYHVYPSNNYPILRAFQGPANYHDLRNASSTSPLLSSRSNLEMSPLPLSRRPVTPQISRLANNTRRSTIQETSFTNNIDTDAVVAKIQNMFPTAEENHIRLLLKSALQVEKHPVTMPGPFVTPPAQRHLFHSNSVFHTPPIMRRLELAPTSRGGGDNAGFTGGYVSRTASPLPGGHFGSAMSMQGGGAAIGMGGMGSAIANAAVNGLYGQMVPSFHGSPRFGDQMRSSPKPHSSPKMKLRYMKTIFPKADETLLLDILANSDNNVQSASEKLIKMGYVKRDFITPRVNNRSEVGGEADKTKKDDIIIIPLRPKEHTEEEKEAMRLRVKQKYDKIAERIILMALESVNYAEDRAIQILQIVQEEDEMRERKASELMQKSYERQTMGEVAARETVTDGKKESNNKKIESLTPCVNITISSPSAATTATIEQIIPSRSSNESKTSSEDSNENLKEVTSIKKKTNLNIFDSYPRSLSPSLSPSISSSSPLFISSSLQIFDKITTKSILDRFNSNETSSSKYLQKANYSNHTHADNILENLKLSRSREKNPSLKFTSHSSTGANVKDHPQSEFKSMLDRIPVKGHNSSLSKGSDDSLLLADYITWNGANPDISMGQKPIVQGPDAALLSKRNYVAVGHNSGLCKGPQPGLAKGSIYSQLTTAAGDIKCK